MRKIKKWVREHFELSIVILILAGIFVTAFFVYNKLGFLNFFFLPVILSGYFSWEEKGPFDCKLLCCFGDSLPIFHEFFTRTEMASHS
jgi:hypothetical protein